ncbi:MAG: phytase, partial [Bacteroidales bacterium]|nr:phytase [Bacteroidales bacterium]
MKTIAFPLFIISMFLILVSCQDQVSSSFPAIAADFETTPVASADDAADDPAIWINNADPGNSLLVCSNKKSGIVVYDLSGNIVGSYDIGKINNVDVRQGIWLNDSTRVDIAAGSNRTDNTISVMQIHPDGSLTDITARKIQSGFAEVYGFCLYHDMANRQVYAIVNNKEGMVEQWLLYSNDSLKLEGKLSRTFKAGESQLEGCVADDDLGCLYIGEEDKGIWKLHAHPDSAAIATNVDNLSNPALKDDIEGLTIFYKENGKGYLIASSQGNNSFAIYTREGDNSYLGSFTIIDSEQTDGVSETDGIDVV